MEKSVRTRQAGLTGGEGEAGAGTAWKVARSHLEVRFLRKYLLWESYPMLSASCKNQCERRVQ